MNAFIIFLLVSIVATVFFLYKYFNKKSVSVTRNDTKTHRYSHATPIPSDDSVYAGPAKMLVCSENARSKSLYSSHMYEVRRGADKACLSSGPAQLCLDNNNILYKVNEKLVWSWKKGPEKVPSEFNDEFVKDPSKWQHVAETSNGLRFHVFPMSITVPTDKSLKRRVLWSFVGGWDPSASCITAKCELPLKAAETEWGTTFMRSPSSALSLLPNGDLMFQSTDKESMIENFCAQN